MSPTAGVHACPAVPPGLAAAAKAATAEFPWDVITLAVLLISFRGFVFVHFFLSPLPEPFHTIRLGLLTS